MQAETVDESWRMRFVMPSQYTLQTLPTAPADISLIEIPARRIAAVRFNGDAPASDLAAMEQDLAEWVGEQGLTVIGDVEYAFYDAAMVPALLRRNEVMVEVAVQ